MIRYENIKITLIAVNEEILLEVCGDPCCEAVWYLDKAEQGEVWCIYNGAFLDGDDLVFELEVVPGAILQIDDDGSISWWEQNFIA